MALAPKAVSRTYETSVVDVGGVADFSTVGLPAEVEPTPFPMPMPPPEDYDTEPYDDEPMEGVFNEEDEYGGYIWD